MLLIMLGGAVGSYLRYLVGEWVAGQTWSREFPVATLIVNVTGSFLLAAAAVIIFERLPAGHHDWYLLLGTGFCGGYTTFSTFAVETYKLVENKHWWLALANVFGSVAAAFAAVVLAVLLVHWIFPQR